MDERKLWGDLKTDSEKAEFLRSGEAWKTGIIAASIVDEIASLFEYRDRVEKYFIEEVEVAINFETFQKGKGEKKCF